jgi:hypothetical protein
MKNKGAGGLVGLMSGDALSNKVTVMKSVILFRRIWYLVLINLIVTAE